MRECLWVSNKFPDNDYKKGGIPHKKFLFYVFWQKKVIVLKIYLKENRVFKKEKKEKKNLKY